MNIGKAIKLCRNQRGLNQATLAEKSSISISYLSLLEQGKRDPNFGTVQNISKALSVPISILTFLAAEPDELGSLDKELIEKLSLASFKLISQIDD